MYIYPRIRVDLNLVPTDERLNSRQERGNENRPLNLPGK